MKQHLNLFIIVYIELSQELSFQISFYKTTVLMKIFIDLLKNRFLSETKQKYLLVILIKQTKLVYN